MKFFSLLETEIPKINEDQLQKSVPDLKDNIPSGTVFKVLILNSLREIRVELSNHKMISNK